MTRISLSTAVFAGMLVALTPLGVAAQSTDDVQREAAELIEQLDSDRFVVRQRAARRLEQMADQPELGPLLAEQFERARLTPETSFEVRKQLDILGRDLPEFPVEPAGEVASEELGRLIELLENEAYGTRLGAKGRLLWLLRNPSLAGPLLVRLNERIAQPRLSVDARAWLEPIHERARAAWLLSDPSLFQWPTASKGQLNQWIDDLVRSPDVGEHQPSNHPGGVARRQLLCELACDEAAPGVKRALESRLADSRLHPAAVKSLQALVDLTQPAMVAEYWENGRHTNVQRLLVDVPSQQPGAPRPSHFDRIDDRTAHCVTGSNLSLGDYPVGTAIPHPSRPGAIFHLVNLPTPRRRMAYEYHLEIDEPQRLVELSRRTVDRCLTEKHYLTEPEFRILQQLDASQVTRFAGRMFHLLADRPMARSPSAAELAAGPLPGVPPLGYQSRHRAARLDGQPSHHAMLCGVLATRGVGRAGADLLAAIEADRFLSPSRSAPYRLEWLALLSIASRDGRPMQGLRSGLPTQGQVAAWPEVDACLASLLERDDPLIVNRPDPPRLGPTAAAVLLRRHAAQPASFGLVPYRNPFLSSIRLTAYRYESADARRRVKQWWEDTK